MSIKDIIKSSVYDSFGAGVNLRFSSICLILCMACLIGAYIYFVYKNFSKAAFYSRDLNITLVGMTVTVAAADADRALSVLRKNGEDAYLLGELVHTDGGVLLEG